MMRPEHQDIVVSYSIGFLILISLLICGLFGCNPAAPSLTIADYQPTLAAAIGVTAHGTPKPTPKPSPSEKCDNCGGSGKVGDGTVFEICPVCDGTGKRASSEPVATVKAHGDARSTNQQTERGGDESTKPSSPDKETAADGNGPSLVPPGRATPDSSAVFSKRIETLEAEVESLKEQVAKCCEVPPPALRIKKLKPKPRILTFFYGDNCKPCERCKVHLANPNSLLSRSLKKHNVKVEMRKSRIGEPPPMFELSGDRTSRYAGYGSGSGLIKWLESQLP